MKKELKEKIDKLAIMTVQLAKLFYFCQRVNSKTLNDFYVDFSKSVDEFAKNELSDFIPNICITGFSSKVSHYDIDDDLREKFGNKVREDSEGSMFCVYVSEKYLKEVLEYLKKYDSLKLDYSFVGYKIGFFRNWSHAEKYLEKNNLTIPDLPIDKNKILELESLEKRKEELRLEIEKIDDEISDLFKFSPKKSL